MQLILLAIIQSLLLCSGQVFLKFALSRMGICSWTWQFISSQLTNWWFIPLLDGLSDGIAKLYFRNAGSHVYLPRGYPDDEMDGYIPDHDRLCTGRKIRYKIKNLQ